MEQNKCNKDQLWKNLEVSLGMTKAQILKTDNKNLQKTIKKIDGQEKYDEAE